VTTDMSEQTLTLVNDTEFQAATEYVFNTI
jgi:hypothetical protein